MKKLLRRLLVKSLVVLQTHKLTRFLTKKKIVILMYHGFVHDQQLSLEENYTGRFLEIGRFKQQLDYLKTHHNVIPIESVVEHYRKGTSLPEYPVVITVDDGYASFYHLALPLLKEADLPATIFVTTNFLDRKEMLWPDRLEYAVLRSTAGEVVLPIAGQTYRFLLQDTVSRTQSLTNLKKIIRRIDNPIRLWVIQELERQTDVSLNMVLDPSQHLIPLEWGQVADALKTGLISVGSHTVSHPILTNCSNVTIRSELQLSKASIEKHLGRSCEVFCYPFGTFNDFNDITRQLVQEADYTCALSTVVGLNDSRSDAFELKRYMVDNRTDWYGFVAQVNGLLDSPHFPIEKILSRQPRHR